MKIFTNNKKNGLRPKSYPSFTLDTDNWDDYSTKCQFYLNYYDHGKVKHEIGEIKILHKEDLRTKLPDKFEALSEEYISLGQDIDFYSELRSVCGESLASEFLVAIRDISWKPNLAIPFETLSSFRNALLRFNTAQKARRFGRAIIHGEDVVESFSFAYKTTIPGAENVTEVLFNFNDIDKVPGHIVGIIGRNATGKTRFLANLAEDLVKIRRTSLEKERQREESFLPRRPIFNRLLALSFSAFDKFARPKSEQVSYVYCGIRSEKGGLSRRGLVERYKSDLSRISESGREREWVHYMREILGGASQELERDMEAEVSGDNVADDALSLLSSGQAISAFAITSLLAWIEDNSIVLFDEPETHLHPNAVASLFKVFNTILNKYKSYSVIATHSPIVIQEIPGKRVVLFEREGNITIAQSLEIETFGENVAELTKHVFDTIEIPSYYKEVLKELSYFLPYESVMALFDNNLSMSAQSFLLSQYAENDDEES